MGTERKCNGRANEYVPVYVAMPSLVCTHVHKMHELT